MRSKTTKAEQVADISATQDKFAQSCATRASEEKAESFVMLIFGGAGDLSQKKLLPALFQLFACGLLQKFSIIATGRTVRTNAEYRQLLAKILKNQLKENFRMSTWQQFAKHLFYKSCDITDSCTYPLLHDLICKHAISHRTHKVIYYAAVKPTLTSYIIDGLAKQGNWQEKLVYKIVLEKPFGVDKKSAQKLNKKLLQIFDEQHVYRIDHYLGKETVQNILFFRYANSIFEPLWNRNYIDHVQITVAEDIGIESRGYFYEESGVIRDIVQNHLLQLIAMIAMEAPAALAPDLIRNERVKVFQSIRQFKQEELAQEIVVGQYKAGKINGKPVVGYRQEKDVATRSLVPTYFAGKLYIDNWRWANVPFYVRTGKRLAKKETKIIIQFKASPLRSFGEKCELKYTNRLVIYIQPEEKISIRFCVKQPGAMNKSQPVNMLFDYNKFFATNLLPAYTRLLLDCMKGDQTLFAREDGIELMWDIVDPIIAELAKKKAIQFYAAGSWGPKGADELLKRDNRQWISE